MSQPRYTVVGADGFLGSRIAAELSSRGEPVLRLTRGDVAPARPLGRVLWCAGVTRDFRRRAFHTVRADVCDLSRLLETGDFERFVYLSSTRVYHGAASGSETARLCVQPQDRDHLYNAAKLLGESLCAASEHRGVRVARLATVCSSDPESTDVVRELARDAALGKAITLHTDLDSARDYVLADDAIAALIALAASGEEPVYNIASGRSVTNLELTRWLSELTGCSVTAAPGAPHRSYPPIDISRAAADLGLQPRPLSVALPEIVASVQ